MIARRGSLLAALVAAVSSGCFGSDPPPIAPSAPNREPIAKVPRPLVIGSTPFDYTALPVIEVSEEAEAVRTRPDRLGSAAIDGSLPLAIELSVGDLAVYAWPKESAQPRSGWAGCSAAGSDNTSVARANGFVVPTRTRDRADVFAAVGVFDHAHCRFEAGREAHALAPAIVPDVLYAVRECLSGCRLSPGNEKRREVVTLFGPPATWITSNHPDAAELTRQQVGPFSRVSLPVTRGGSSSAALLVEPAALLAFQRQAAAPTTRELTQYTVEIVWSEADPSPVATAYVATAPYVDPVSDTEMAARRRVDSP